MAVDARNERAGSIIKGMAPISTVEGLAALGELIAADATHAAAMPIDWRAFARAYPAFAAEPFLELVVPERNAVGMTPARLSIAALLSEPVETQFTLAAGYLRTEAARVLGIAADLLDVTTPLSSFGFDSLMAVQLKNRIEADLGITIAMINILHGPSVERLILPVLEAAQGSKQAAADSHDAVSEVWEEGTI
jgi:acyl carrier protein